MDDKTREALERSIQKWEELAATGDDKLGRNNCSLCDLFWNRHCTGCPVFESTGKSLCIGTPYEQVEHASRAELKCPERVRVLAEQELMFLKSLRPGGTGN